MPDGVTGNTSDFGSEESRFEPWSGNTYIAQQFVYQNVALYFLPLAALVGQVKLTKQHSTIWSISKISTSK